MRTGKRRPATADPDLTKGALEGDRPDQPQQFNPNAGALDDNGLPARLQPICEDVIGANVDRDALEAGTAGVAVVPTETGKAPGKTGTS